jgi:AraC-like DNA-binding protein
MGRLIQNLYDLVMSTNPFFRRTLEIDSGVGRVSQAGELLKTGSRQPPQPARVFGRYALVYLLAGSGVYVDARQGPLPVEPGSLILVFPKLAHGYGPRRGERWHEVYLVFEGPLIEQWEKARLLDPRRPIWRLPGVELWSKRIRAVIDPLADRSPAAALVELCRLQQLLAEMLDVQQPRKSNWLARAQEAMDRTESPQAAAAQMQCSYTTFRRRFTRLQGVSPGRHFQQRRLERACRLMHEGELSDKQIAAELGFCDEFHFSHTFKRHVGLTPRQYRRGLP